MGRAGRAVGVLIGDDGASVPDPTGVNDNASRLLPAPGDRRLQVRWSRAGCESEDALSVGLKVDADALPADLVASMQKGSVNLDDPATTVGVRKAPGRYEVVGVREWPAGID